MERELLDHTARVLRAAPGRCMDGRALYDRVSRETGVHCGASLLLQKLRDCPDRFSILPGTAPLHVAIAWTDAERRAYAGMMPMSEQAGPPLVALCEAEAASAEGDPAAPPIDPGELGVIHQSVAELLRNAGADLQLNASIGSAMAALGLSVARQPDGVSRSARGAARSTTAPRRPRPR